MFVFMIFFLHELLRICNRWSQQELPINNLCTQINTLPSIHLFSPHDHSLCLPELLEITVGKYICDKTLVMVLFWHKNSLVRCRDTFWFGLNWMEASIHIWITVILHVYYEKLTFQCSNWIPPNIMPILFNLEIHCNTELSWNAFSSGL